MIFHSKVLHRLLVGFCIAFVMSLNSTPVRSQAITNYESHVDLPITLFTSDGIEIEKGKYELEVRASKAGYALAFLHERKVLAVVNGQTGFSGNSDVPIVGTIYLYAAKGPDDSSQDSDHSPQQKDNRNFVLGDFLQSRPWNASLRVYGSKDPTDAAVYFILQRKVSPGVSSSRAFKLFRNKPS